MPTTKHIILIFRRGTDIAKGACGAFAHTPIIILENHPSRSK